ncbi:toxin-antitoxin system YwqK family antitoxin [Pinibacter aurantiacus]|uniref:Uncharacterized protein n=1 Tax=Pinibacter aurantiacus TaxID=2851599 RepID=A0A9E2SAC5_9BACT|nr:hypothetical protein [Pinibacter aurantiacus]MBV4359376.1 hypothetical protein [Pinibacter aurantiacus]
MKKIALRFSIVVFIMLSIVGTSMAQQWKSYIVGVKGDTLNRVDKQDKKQGKWVVRIESLRGEPGYEEEGVFVDGRKEDTWRKYSLMGDLLAVENYKWGMKDGSNLYYSSLTGNVAIEESWLAINPDKKYDTIDVENVDDPGHFTRVIIKNEGASLKHGTWKYFDPTTGFVTKTEFYHLGKLDADPLAKAASTDSPTSVKKDAAKASSKPKEVEDFEKQNSGKKKVRVRDGATGY